MSKFKFELDSQGVKNLLKSTEMQNILDEYASKVQLQAGEGYDSEVHVGQNRAYANIYPETYEAFQDNLDNNTLLISLH